MTIHLPLCKGDTASTGKPAYSDMERRGEESRGEQRRRGEQEATCSAVHGKPPTLKNSPESELCGMVRIWLLQVDRYLVRYTLNEVRLKSLAACPGWPLLWAWPAKAYRDDSAMKMMYWIQRRAAPRLSVGVWVLLHAGNRLFRCVNTLLCSATPGLPGDTRGPLGVTVSWGLERVTRVSDPWRFESWAAVACEGRTLGKPQRRFFNLE